MAWLKASCLVVVYLITSFLFVYAQIDPQLCPDGAITVLDPKWPSISTSFELFAELTSNAGSSNIVQTLGNGRDIIIETANGETVMEYWYFDTNEQFTILNMDKDADNPPVCLRQVIDPLSITSTIQTTVFLKPSVLLGYDARDVKNPNFGTKFIGTSQIRSMPVNVFQSCFYLTDLRQTIAVTYHMTNIEEFLSFGYVNHSVPLRIEVRTKPPLGGDERTYFYNIFRFLPELTVGQQRQALSIPTGIFCSEQINTKPVPSNFSNQIFSTGEALILSGTEITAESVNMIYNKPFRFARFEALLKNGEQVIELHDFATGLIYRYLALTRQCTVSPINNNTNDAIPIPGQSQLLQMANPLHLFLLDDMSFQYTGSRGCHNGMLCHVWIGQKSLSNELGFERREWYWAYQINNQSIEPWIPIRLINTRLDAENKLISLTETNLYIYQTNVERLMEIDSTIADCYRALGPTEEFYYGIFTFVIDNPDQNPVQNYSNYLKIIIWSTLTETLQIRPIRLSNVFIDRNGTDLIVTFTLVDNPPFNGPVVNPLNEPKLDTVVKNLRILIDAKNISFVSIYNDSQSVRLYPKPGSLNVIARTPTITLTNNITIIDYETIINTTKVTKLLSMELSSGSKITAFWIGFLALGIVIGIAGVWVGARLIARNRK